MDYSKVNLDGIKGVVFDFGSVICEPIAPDARIFDLWRDLGLTRHQWDEGFAKYRRQWDSGLITGNEMYRRMLSDCGIETHDPAQLEKLGFGGLPICMAKTQYSLSDDASKLGRPRGFSVTVRELRVSAGAGFIVALTGDILTMPGLPKKPAAEAMDIDESGRITGLF